ncbi:DUF397 domain-containing protein [Actinomadura rupiterrae]|uniref:DUF397 domain-containing protein n=1 Tax=Actinomadura rupiterrae TaxID=559627 RepID=UPI0027E290B6|nr:DUF397 domain-containing protein [Actinomadura rupiterrae]
MARVHRTPQARRLRHLSPRDQAAMSNGTGTRFRKSSFSDGGNGCVEVAASGRQCSVRDSRDAGGAVLTVDAASWRCLLERVRGGANSTSA